MQTISVNTSIEILKDKSCLQEIYKLRVDSWEGSKDPTLITHEKYPMGFSDELDEISTHLIVRDDEGKIRSACRVTYFDNASDFPFISLNNMVDFPKGKFGLIGRGARHNDFYIKHLQKDFIKLSLELCKQEGAGFAIGLILENNPYMQQIMIDLGFTVFQNIKPEEFKDKNFALDHKLFIINL